MPLSLGCRVVPAGREGGRKKSGAAGLKSPGLTDQLLGLGKKTLIAWKSET